MIFFNHSELLILVILLDLLRLHDIFNVLLHFQMNFTFIFLSLLFYISLAMVENRLDFADLVFIVVVHAEQIQKLIFGFV